MACELDELELDELLRELDESSVLIADELTPSVAAQVDWTKVRGFATDAGSRTYHTAILARSLEVPAVVGLHNASERVQRYRIGVEQLPSARVEGGEEIVLGPAEARWVPVAVRVPPEVAARMGSGASGMTLLVEQLRQGDRPQVDVREHTTFMVPR